MAERHGGALLAECLVALGARRCYGVPGESYLPLLDALHDRAGELDFIGCRHEGGAAFMAAAHGKLMRARQPGIALVTRGPGACNAAIGVHTAMQDSAPLLLLVGQVASAVRGREAFQELDYRALFAGLAKWAVEIDRVERLAETIGRAWSLALSGRPGPVVVALPEDVLAATSDAPALAGAPPRSAPAPAPWAITQCRQVLADARRPVILISGCDWGAASRAALQRYAEAAQIPVLAAFRYQDQFDNHSPAFAGEAGVGMPAHVRALLARSDAVLALGARFGENSTDGYTVFAPPVPRQALLHVHAAADELAKVYQPRLAVHAHPGAAAEALAAGEAAPAVDRGAYVRAARAAFERSQIAAPQPSPVDMGTVMRYLQRRLPADAILCNGAGNFAIWPNKFFAFGPAQRLLAPQSGAMGYGLPAAIAAALEHPDRTVLCFAGDGDLQMSIQELGTAAQAGVAVLVLLLNNASYGTIRVHQERRFPGRVCGTDLRNPDFCVIATAYGLHAERVVDTDGFAAAFERALASPSGALLDLDVALEAAVPGQPLSAIRAAARGG